MFYVFLYVQVKVGQHFWKLSYCYGMFANNLSLPPLKEKIPHVNDTVVYMRAEECFKIESCKILHFGRGSNHFFCEIIFQLVPLSASLLGGMLWSWFSLRVVVIR